MNFIKWAETHKPLALKLFAGLVAAILFIGAGVILVNSQNLKALQAKQSQSAVANHTQTLNEIAAGVNQIKSNQFANSTTLETFIRDGLVCTAANPLPLNPSTVQIQLEADKCFPNSQKIK